MDLVFSRGSLWGLKILMTDARDPDVDLFWDIKMEKSDACAREGLRMWISFGTWIWEGAMRARAGERSTISEI